MYSTHMQPEVTRKAWKFVFTAVEAAEVWGVWVNQTPLGPDASVFVLTIAWLKPVLLGDTGVGEKHNETAPSEAVVKSKFSTT
jgi:hypothetical protein